ncbi:organic cation transporter protein [Bombyx mori]|uniref:Organic cation transporter n=1 Tax=Bombyx mori TaxID=7091 RepID=A0A8R2HM76_BOMMO|nr:organic cation transporter protein [Bombyx mori]XP_021204536.1 organic cation transporter protein [Bombyx mori]XP_037875334.1 organic cation transporter protein [Bombyx mori]
MVESQLSDSFNLDGILSELGSFGKYQLLFLLLLSFRDSFLAMCNFNYVFTADEVKFRCAIPECDTPTPSFNATWTAFALPNTTDTCYRMAPLLEDRFNRTGQNVQSLPNKADPPYTCSPEYFDANRTLGCDKLVYEDYNSIVAEFDLGCEPWKRTMIGTVHNLGLVFSFIISGIISDRYGRKVIIVGTPLVVGVVGLVKSFSVKYWMLLVLEFFETAFGYGNASMVLSLEMVSQKRRVIFSSMSDVLCSLGSAFFGLIAWMVPYWRHLMWAIYAPLLVVVFYIFLIDEGVRWLLVHNRKDEAVRVLHKVAKFNNITLSSKATDMMTKITERNKTSQTEPPVEQERLHLLSLLSSKKIIIRVAIISVSFICCTYVYNGTIITSTSVLGNKYLNFSALHLVSIPTRLLTAYTFTKFGRKIPICVAYCLCAVFFVASAFVPKSFYWVSTLLYLAGRMCSSYGMFSMTVVAMEVFPTKSRNSLTNVANTIGRIGSILAPQAPLLEKYMSGLSSIIFGIVSLGPALLAFLLPDTSKVSLPDDITEAENLDVRPEESDPTCSVPASGEYRERF